jgi:hypothetical protein
MSCPSSYKVPKGRRAWLDRELARDTDRVEEHVLDAERIVARIQGRAGWLREAKRQQEQDRWRDATPVYA